MTTTKAHPFEESGNGIGPFSFAGVISLPSRALQEHNPSAFNLQMSELWGQARNLGVRLGSCDHCGTGIVHHAIIRDSEGKRFVVGMDCVAKTSKDSLGSRAKIEKARVTRERIRESKAIKHEKWLASPSKQDSSKTNAQIRQEKIDAQNAKREAAQQEIKARAKVVCAKWKFFVERLGKEQIERSGFLSSIARGLVSGQEPSGRGLDICAEIFAKTFGRGNSKAFEDAVADFWKEIDRKEVK